jgi:hypothetical protein
MAGCQIGRAGSPPVEHRDPAAAGERDINDVASDMVGAPNTRKSTRRAYATERCTYLARGVTTNTRTRRWKVEERLNSALRPRRR